MNKNYLSKIVLKKNSVLITSIDEELKNKDIIISSEEKKKLSLSSYADHPFRGKVIKLGNGIEEHLPGIKEGDIVYLERLPDVSDLININGDIYFRIFYSNISLYRKSE